MLGFDVALQIHGATAEDTVAELEDVSSKSRGGITT
jgi:hypothetical protein